MPDPTKKKKTALTTGKRVTKGPLTKSGAKYGYVRGKKVLLSTTTLRGKKFVPYKPAKTRVHKKIKIKVRIESGNPNKGNSKKNSATFY